MRGHGSALSRLALWAIRSYQRHLSPYKGFSCAYRVATGGAGCSAYGYRAIERHGLLTGLALLDRRLQRCGAVHRALRSAPNPRLHYQRGDCDCFDCGDLPCDACSVDWGDCRKGRRCGCDAWRDWRERRWLAKAGRLQRERAERERRERFERERSERR